MSSSSSQAIFKQARASTLRDLLKDLGHKQWGNLTRSDMIEELRKIGQNLSDGEDDALDREEKPKGSKSKSTAKPRKSLSAPGPSRKGKASTPSEDEDNTDSISRPPTTRASQRKVEEEEKTANTRSTRSKAVSSHPAQKPGPASKRKRGQESVSDNEGDGERSDDDDESEKPAKRTRQTEATSTRSTRSRAQPSSEEEPAARSTRSKGPALAPESISSPAPRTTRGKHPKPGPASKTKNAVTNDSPVRSTRSRAVVEADMDVDEPVPTSRATRSRAADTSPSRATRSRIAEASPSKNTRARAQPDETQLPRRTGSRNKTYVSREARASRRRSRSAASGSEAEPDINGVDDADVPVPSDEEQEEEEEEEEEEKPQRQTRGRGAKASKRAISAPAGGSKKGRGRVRKTPEEPAEPEEESTPKRPRGRPRKEKVEEDGERQEEEPEPSISRARRNRSAKQPTRYPTYASTVAEKERSENTVVGKAKLEKAKQEKKKRGRPSGTRNRSSAPVSKTKEVFDGVEVPHLSKKYRVEAQTEDEEDGEYDIDPEEAKEDEQADVPHTSDVRQHQTHGSGDDGPQQPQDQSRDVDMVLEQENIDNEVESTGGEWGLSLADGVLTGSSGPVNQDDAIGGEQDAEQPVHQPEPLPQSPVLQDGTTQERPIEKNVEFEIPQLPETDEEESEMEGVRGVAQVPGMDDDSKTGRLEFDDGREIEKQLLETGPSEQLLNSHDDGQEGEGVKLVHQSSLEPVPVENTDMEVDHPASEHAEGTLVTPTPDDAQSRLFTPEDGSPSLQTQNEPDLRLQESIDDVPRDHVVSEVQVIQESTEIQDNQVHLEKQVIQEDQVVQEGQSAPVDQFPREEAVVQGEQVTQVDQVVHGDQVLQTVIEETSATLAPLPPRKDSEDEEGEKENALPEPSQAPEEPMQPTPSTAEERSTADFSMPSVLDLAALHSRPAQQQQEVDVEPEVNVPSPMASATIAHEPELVAPPPPPSNRMPSLSALHSRPSPGEEDEVDYGEEDEDYGGPEDSNDQLLPSDNVGSLDDNSLDSEKENMGPPRLSLSGTRLEPGFEQESGPSSSSNVLSAGATPEALNGFGYEDPEDVRDEFNDTMDIDVRATVVSEEGDEPMAEDDGTMYLNEEAFAMDTEESQLPANGHGVSPGGAEKAVAVVEAEERLEVVNAVGITDITAATTATTTFTTL
ncbi:hypothetical protein PQX77_014917 [Marasmius sp. AFHP31]|nr:hypothetical protein PQX77_014917 [Marasmius sp. AFHP31]